MHEDLTSLSSRMNWSLRIVAALVAFLVVQLYGFPPLWQGIAFLLLLVPIVRSPLASALTLACSVLVMSVVLEAAIRYLGIEGRLYYRPHEILKHEHPLLGNVYQPSRRLVMEVPFNDIEAMAKVGILEPHRVVFKTDGLGFRNDRDYRAGDLVLLGDSFVVGMADSQECLIQNQLMGLGGLPAYNLGYPGGVREYRERLEAFRKLTGTTPRVALFVFEGNDFEVQKDSRVRLPEPLAALQGEFRQTALWRFTRSIYVRAFKSNGPGVASVAGTGERSRAFLKDYSEVTRRETVPESIGRALKADLDAMASSLWHLYFIPTSARVYTELAFGEPADRLPDAQARFLADWSAGAGVPFTDLTPALRAAARSESVFWRADTHWNCAGQAVAARQLAEDLKRALPATTGLP